MRRETSSQKGNARRHKHSSTKAHKVGRLCVTRLTGVTVVVSELKGCRTFRGAAALQGRGDRGHEERGPPQRLARAAYLSSRSFPVSHAGRPHVASFVRRSSVRRAYMYVRVRACVRACRCRRGAMRCGCVRACTRARNNALQVGRKNGWPKRGLESITTRKSRCACCEATAGGGSRANLAKILSCRIDPPTSLVYGGVAWKRAKKINKAPKYQGARAK